MRKAIGFAHVAPCPKKKHTISTRLEVRFWSSKQNLVNNNSQQQNGKTISILELYRSNFGVKLATIDTRHHALIIQVGIIMVIAVLVLYDLPAVTYVNLPEAMQPKGSIESSWR